MSRFIQPSEIQVGDKIKVTWDNQDCAVSNEGTVNAIYPGGEFRSASGWTLYSRCWGDPNTKIELLHREVKEPTEFGSMVKLDDGRVGLRWGSGARGYVWSTSIDGIGEDSLHEWDDIKDRVVAVFAPACSASPSGEHSYPPADRAEA